MGSCVESLVAVLAHVACFDQLHLHQHGAASNMSSPYQSSSIFAMHGSAFNECMKFLKNKRKRLVQDECFRKNY